MADNLADATQALMEASLRAALKADPAKPSEPPAPEADPEAAAAAERAARNAEAERLRELARSYGPSITYRGRPMSEFAKPGNYAWATGRPMGRGPNKGQ
jgi:hypothetical protein